MSPDSLRRDGGARKREVPRIALTRPEAAAALGMSLTSFERHVQPDLRVVRRGTMRLVPVRDLERWVEDNAARILERAL